MQIGHSKSFCFSFASGNSTTQGQRKTFASILCVLPLQLEQTGLAGADLCAKMEPRMVQARLSLVRKD